jgi:hypothetical protein
MSLTQLWKNSRDQFENKQLHQIIAFAGEGKLRDGNITSLEFREFLSVISSETLRQYADNCLNAAFTDSGLALQDIVNQIGVRLGFDVEDGFYQGSRNNIGNDGLWKFPSEHCVVIEVKTTDAYRIDSDKIADYRRRLIATQQITEESSSILIVVGRQDTGDLEAQIRGSRHAWDIRLISVDSLLNLMILKENVDDPQIIQRICEILIPKEFTRLDSIIDIVFSTAEEAKEEVDIIGEEITSEEAKTKIVKPASFHLACVEKFSIAKGKDLIQQSRNKFISLDKNTRVVCSVSKFHERENSYWFAFHPHQQEFLSKAQNSYLLLGCGSPDKTLAIPYADLFNWLNDLWTTEETNRMYWHLRIQNEDSAFLLNRKQGLGKLDISKYRI